MAELDHSIVLGAGQINDPAKMLSLQAMAQALKANEQKAKAQNALRQMLAQPGAIDPTTGMPTAQTIGSIAQSGDVTTAATLADKQSEIAKRSQETQLKKLDLWKENAAGPAQIAYEQAIARGVAPPEAAQIAESVLNEGLDGLAKTGAFSSDEQAKFVRKFDPATNASRIETYDKFKERELDKQKFDLSEKNAERRAEEAAAREERLLKVMDMRQAQNSVDPNDPSDKQLIDAIANYQIAAPTPGRNPVYRENVLKEVLKTNPEWQEGRFANANAARKAFATGKQGDTVRSLNVSVAHLETLRKLGEALESGDSKAINSVRQTFAEQFGKAAPTNFDTAKAIVADEVAKGVIGGQTAQSDRETLAASLRRSGSPAQISGAINTFQELLGGQLKGLRDQYNRSTGSKDFETFLLPETKEALERDEKKPKPPPKTTQAAPTLPEAARASLKEGVVTTFKNGQRWTLKAGQPAQVK